ncbi:MAG: hypothetical protein AB7G07_06740 [Bauldia sp.]
MVQAGSGYVAVCGNSPNECDPVPLDASDIAILELDRRRLVAELGRLLQFDVVMSEDRGVIRMGQHFVAAGRGFPVLLLLPDPQNEVTIDHPTLRGAPSAIVVSTSRSISAHMKEVLVDRGHLIIVLAEIIGAGDNGQLVAARPTLELLNSLRTSLDGSPNRPALDIPAGTKWEDVEIEIISREAALVRAAKRTQRVGPEELGMKNQKNGKPTTDWWTLLALAHGGGRLSATGTGRSHLTKRKQLLSKGLSKCFGISDDPIHWDQAERQYGARFRITITDTRTIADEISELLGRTREKLNSGRKGSSLKA